MKQDNKTIIENLKQSKEKILSEEKIKQMYYRKFHKVQENGKVFIKKRKFMY